MTATLTFDYQVVDAEGHRSKGRLQAADTATAAASLRAQGVVPLTINQAGRGLHRELRLTGLSGGISSRDLAVFARQFATLINSGLSLLSALAIVEQQAERPALTRALAEIRTDVESGSSLSDAFGRQDRCFPTIMVAMIRAGETGGFLDSALHRIAITLEKDAALRGKIKSAMTYPAVVLGFSAVMIAVVLVFIVPIFERMFSQLGGSLPLPTRIVVGISHAAAWLFPLLAVLTVCGWLLLRRAIARRPNVRRAVDGLKLRLPVVGDLIGKIAVARFARNLGILLGVGVPALRALDVVGATAGNQLVGEAAEAVSAAIRSGAPMSVPLAASPVFAPMVAQMVAVGEESGQISEMLDKIADFYERDVDQATESLTATIEPLMVVIMGGLIGAMVICLYLPMFTVYQHIQGAT